MVYRVLADVVLVAHLCFILFAVLGGLLALRWRRAVWAHLPAAAWAITVSAASWVCPLTPLENTLRQLGGQAGYHGGFIEHYLLNLLYPGGLTHATQLGLALGVLLVNGAVYALLLLRTRRPDDELKPLSN